MPEASDVQAWLPILITTLAIMFIFQATILTYGGALATALGQAFKVQENQLRPVAFGIITLLILLFSTALMLKLWKNEEVTFTRIAEYGTIIVMLFAGLWVVNSYFAIFI